MNRRNFIKVISSGLVMGMIGCGSEEYYQSHYDFSYIQTNYLRPPGAIAEKKFLENCINCVLCGAACPKGCITFFTTSLEKTVVPHTPYIVAAKNACDLCLECTTVCPTGSLLPVEKMEDVRMGLAVLKENLCLPYINQGGCGACYTICPLNAVELDMQRYPKVIDDKCVGCGLCEEICPQKVKAIRVILN